MPEGESWSPDRYLLETGKCIPLIEEGGVMIEFNITKGLEKLIQQIIDEPLLLLCIILAAIVVYELYIIQNLALS
jgi:hypothetical protein